MSNYDTNLASGFYVLSCLHRRGLDANLTLGNKKGVDIVVVRQAGEAVTVNVKGVAKKYDWPANNLATDHPERHFVALVNFEGQIEHPSMPAPHVWIIPYKEIAPFIRRFPGGRINVCRAAVKATGARYKDAWELIEGSIIDVGREGDGLTTRSNDGPGESRP